jgi:30S ribosomal protein S31
MGRGDKRTRRGKITMGSFGKTRLARAVKKATTPIAIGVEKKA